MAIALAGTGRALVSTGGALTSPRAIAFGEGAPWRRPGGSLAVHWRAGSDARLERAVGALSRVSALVEAKEAWATELGTLDAETRSITRGQLVMPRIAAPSQQTALRNHPSWEKDEDAKQALGPVIASQTQTPRGSKGGKKDGKADAKTAGGKSRSEERLNAARCRANTFRMLFSRCKQAIRRGHNRRMADGSIARFEKGRHLPCCLKAALY